MNQLIELLRELWTEFMDRLRDPIWEGIAALIVIVSTIFTLKAWLPKVREWLLKAKNNKVSLWAVVLIATLFLFSGVVLGLSFSLKDDANTEVSRLHIDITISQKVAQYHIDGQVTDADNSIPIKNAKVTLECLQEIAVHTVSEGFFKIKVPISEAQFCPIIEVNAEGYEHYNRYVPWPSRNISGGRNSSFPSPPTGEH